ncbi:LysR family transcriptional regulator [Clostridium tyrobutyricum]|uniref:LysR family transcriptional regulator n=1 Tax=Clostridium tyrobutyricum TaxID=1519 RepID=UPI0005802409|nr:LysR family transcriptional regulator [Clostridium tyrobutyricum]
MELKYLNTFKIILETGSFQKAAEYLNYAQSTVTFQIQQLEQELSVKLFEKIGRKMIITQAGKDVLPYIDAILQSVQQLENYGKDMQQITGTLKISMPETLLTYRMQPILRAFRQQAPGVKLSVQALNCYTIRNQIVNGGADIGIHYDVGGYGSTIMIEKLATFPLALVACPALGKQDCDFIKTKQRKSVCLITNDRESIFQKMFDNYLKEQDIVIDGIMELGSIEAIKRSVVSNLGIAYLPQYVVEEELENGTLKELKTGISDKKITAICSYHKNKWITPAMGLFIRLLKENL